MFTQLRGISVPFETKADIKVYPSVSNAHGEQVQLQAPKRTPKTPKNSLRQC